MDHVMEHACVFSPSQWRNSHRHNGTLAINQRNINIAIKGCDVTWIVSLYPYIYLYIYSGYTYISKPGIAWPYVYVG